MTGSHQDGRHLTYDGLGAYVSAGVSAALKIDGTPVVYVIVEPASGSVALRTPVGPRGIPDLSGYRHVSAATVQWNDKPWYEVRVDGAPIVATYPVLCGIADRIQLDGQDFSRAVRDSLAALRQLFAQNARLSDEQEVGLFGELRVLQHLIDRMGGPAAVDCWRGPHGEEHDFDIDGDDVEVKATLSENRRHWIGHIGQLQSTLGRSLWLVSIQLTTAAAVGTSLPMVVGAIRSSLTDAQSVDDFDRRLEAVGWRNEDTELYQRRLRLRSRPLVFEVDVRFPALTTARLAAAALDPVRFSQVRYMIDLDGYPPTGVGPAPLIDVCLGADG
jgi:Putative  PD-(D/E)XK family member, (DUF4420)